MVTETHMVGLLIWKTESTLKLISRISSQDQMFQNQPFPGSSWSPNSMPCDAMLPCSEVQNKLSSQIWTWEDRKRSNCIRQEDSM